MPSLELDLSPLIEHLVERIVDEVTERLAARLVGDATPPPSVPEPPREPEPAPVPPPVQPRTRKQRVEGEKRTCEVCSRVGTRRYVQTSTGWKCSPTATACSPQFKPPGKYTRPAVSGIPAKEFPPNVTPDPDPMIVLAAGMREHGEAVREQMASEPAVTPSRVPGVTARCQDCTRTFTLTGRVLKSAVEMHELKASHIVTVFEADDGQELSDA